MKRIATFLILLTLVGGLISFKSDHGNIITFDNGQSYVWRADNCIAPNVPALSQRVMSSSKGFYSVDVTFQLPAGHCDIPASGTTVTRYSSEQWAVIHSDGLVLGKILIKPHGH